MSLGLFVSINQRLDADTITLLAEEYGFSVKFTTVEEEKEIEIHDDEADLKPRAPIVTIMGHVDHGKTKLLDYVRQSNVISGEAGGITQHIGAYRVKVGNDNNEITFLDTPGHEAFTAMRARGAQVTDIAIIIVAADDGIMPQTKEAISHAQAAGVPMVFAINKIDKPTANADRIREQLANMNILVEAWGGKYQCQEISAKTGQGVPELLEKILLEAELLELKANPNALASGVVIEASLEKGKGYVATLLIQRGTLKMKDIVIAGTVFGHIRAMYNESGEKVTKAGPSVPVIVLGLNGAPQAGDSFKVTETDSEAKEIATKREQLLREQTMRTKKHITLDEVSRRLKLGNFKELNFIIKADVDGSIEALADAIIKLSNEEISINVIHKAVGQISESDVMLATASDAVIIGFQVRPSLSARKLAEKEQVDIRLYSVIYDAINEIKDAMEGMLSPEIKETIIGSAEVLNIFKISKVGKVLGCRVVEGKITRDSNVRLIRDGIVIFTGKLSSLKRYKDDAKEVNMGMECGLSIENFSDAKVDDVVEAYIETEVKRTL
jgi:translation initiation factor IF-2